MPNVELGSVKSEEAIAHLREKLRIPTERWDDMLGDTHAKGFTVAGATKADLLKDFHKSILRMQDEGLTIEDFRKDFDEIVTRHGWSYKGKRGWRTRVIYQTNMSASAMAGKWAKIEAAKWAFPYLMYDAIEDKFTRDQHLSWNNLVLPVDHAFWNTHYPPNGYGCRCNARQLSDSQMNKEGLSVSPDPDIRYTPRVNRTTGRYYGETPEGIDTGFDYNVGKAWLGPDIKFGEQLMEMPAKQRGSALQYQEEYLQAQTQSWQHFLNRFKERGSKSNGSVHSAGYMPSPLLDVLATKKGIVPRNALITVKDKDIPHLEGSHKSGKTSARNRSGTDKSLPSTWLDNLPLRLSDYQAVLWDKEHQNILVVLKGDVSGKKGRAAVAIDVQDKVQRKKVTYNVVRSLGVIDKHNLKEASRYELLDGKI